jgi:hypothetical protein
MNFESGSLSARRPGRRDRTEPGRHWRPGDDGAA